MSAVRRGSAIGYESWWRSPPANSRYSHRPPIPYRPVKRRYADGHTFDGFPFKLEKVLKIEIRYRREKTLSDLLIAGGFVPHPKNGKVSGLKTYDEDILDLSAQYDIEVHDVVNLNLFASTEHCPSISGILFSRSISFTDACPVDIVALASQYPAEH